MPPLVANLMRFGGRGRRRRKKSSIICLDRELNPGLLREKREHQPLRHRDFVKDNAILKSLISSSLCKAIT